jgi:hypothetical protein
VKSLVELHGGVVSLRSTPGAGTTITVLLPEHGSRRIQAQNGDGGKRSENGSAAGPAPAIKDGLAAHGPIAAGCDSPPPPTASERPPSNILAIFSQ